MTKSKVKTTIVSLFFPENEIEKLESLLQDETLRKSEVTFDDNVKPQTLEKRI